MVSKVYLEILLTEDGWVFEKFILADEPFARALQSLKTCVTVNDSLLWKLFPSSESTVTFYELFKVNSVPPFFPNFNFLSWQFYISMLYHNILMILCEKSKILFFISSIMKKLLSFYPCTDFQ